MNNKMKLALSTGLFDHVEIKRLPGILPLLKEAGFRYLEAVDRPDFNDNMNVLDDLRKKVDKYDIQIPNWHLIQYPPLQNDGKINRTAVECMKYSMDKGSRIGAKNHVLHWDNRYIDPGYNILWRDVIDEWTRHAEKLGIRLLMETVPDKPSNQRYVASEEIIDFVRSYPPEVLAVCVDVNHSNLQEKLPDVIHKVKDRLISLHISDNDGREEKHWLPGQGVINFPSLVESLKSIKFDGMLVMEVNRWCEKPEELSALKSLYELGVNILNINNPCLV